MQTRDYLERLIRQIAEALLAVAGFTAQKKYDEAEQTLDGAWSNLGLRRRDVARLDDATIAALLGAKKSYGAQLLEAEADVAAARGDLPRAAALRARAATLRG
jgi:hypothetical protein